MNLFRAHRTFVFLLALLLASAGALGAAGLAAQRRLHAAERAWRARWGEAEALRQRASAREEAALDRDLARLRAEVAQARVNRWPEARADDAPGGPARNRTQMFFALSEFTERIRRAAAQRGVQVRPEERFGFAAFAREAPAEAALAQVERQRAALEQLLPLLLAARPREIMTVERGEPAGGPHTGKWALDARVSLQVKGVAESDTFCFVFTGPTTVLRRFLNAVAGGPWPAAVRTVRVEPAAPPLADRTDPRGQLLAETMTASPRPAHWLVRPALSRFTVTIEWLRPAGDPEHS